MNKYRLVSKKGEGTFSEVLKASSIVTGELFAIKCMKSQFKSLEQVNSLREIQALKRLNPHPNIIHLEEILFDSNSGRLALVFELMQMNLYEKIKNLKQALPSDLVENLMFQLLKATAHMHGLGIFHRDLKPENVLLSPSPSSPFPILKIADFGSCRGLHTPPPHTEYISTRWYRAPEALLTNGMYDYKMDNFGLGTVFFEIVALFPLFPGTNELDQIEKIHAIIGTPPPELLSRYKSTNPSSHMKNINFSPRAGSGIARLIPHASPEAVDLMMKLLAYDPDKRISAKQALKHPYFKESRERERKEKIANNNSNQTQSQNQTSSNLSSNMNSHFHSHSSFNSNPNSIPSQFPSSIPSDLPSSLDSSPQLVYKIKKKEKPHEKDRDKEKPPEKLLKRSQNNENKSFSQQNSEQQNFNQNTQTMTASASKSLLHSKSRQNIPLQLFPSLKSPRQLNHENSNSAAHSHSSRFPSLLDSNNANSQPAKHRNKLYESYNNSKNHNQQHQMQQQHKQSQIHNQSQSHSQSHSYSHHPLKLPVNPQFSSPYNSNSNPGSGISNSLPHSSSHLISNNFSTSESLSARKQNRKLAAIQIGIGGSQTARK